MGCLYPFTSFLSGGVYSKNMGLLPFELTNHIAKFIFSNGSPSHILGQWHLLVPILKELLECYSPCTPTDFPKVTLWLKRRFATGSAFDRTQLLFWSVLRTRLIRSRPYRVSAVATAPTCVRGADPPFLIMRHGPTTKSIFPPSAFTNLIFVTWTVLVVRWPIWLKSLRPFNLGTNFPPYRYWRMFAEANVCRMVNPKTGLT